MHVGRGRGTRRTLGQVKGNEEAGENAERRSGKQAAAATGGSAAPEPLPPWHEVAAAWQRVRATFDGLFQSDEEEEQMRVAIHQGGARWRTFLTPSMSESATDVDR